MKEPRVGQTPNLTDSEGRPVNPLLWYMLFQQTMRQLEGQRWTGVPATIDIDIGANLLVNGKSPAAIKLSTKVRRITEEVSLASVVEYADPIAAASHAEIGTFDLGASEFIDAGDNVAMTVDLSTIAIPENCCFETVTLDAGRVVNIRPNIIGAEHVFTARIPIQLRYEFASP